MFLGEYHHTIDVKGRLVMPYKFREQLGQCFVVTKGLDKCLFVYTLDEWMLFNEKMKQLPLTDEGVRRFARFFFGGATEVGLDNQGRIALPLNLRDYSEIKKDIISIGVSNRIEIWSKQNWNEYNSDYNNVDLNLADKMALLGI